MSDRTQSSVDVESSEQPNSPETAGWRSRPIPEFPTVAYLWKQLADAKREVHECLKKVTSASELRMLWAGLRDDLHRREILAIAPDCIQMTWAIMRQMSDERGLPAPSAEPNIVLPLYDKAGIPIPPRQPDFRSDHHRCRSAYIDVDGRDIPVDERRLRNAVDDILNWCRDVERRDEEDDPLLDRIADILTVQQNKIIKHIWNQKGAGFDALTRIPGAFRGMPDDETIIKALQRTQKRLNKYPEYRISLSVSKPKRRVQLERPPDK